MKLDLDSTYVVSHLPCVTVYIYLIVVVNVTERVGGNNLFVVLIDSESVAIATFFKLGQQSLLYSSHLLYFDILVTHHRGRPTSKRFGFLVWQIRPIHQLWGTWNWSTTHYTPPYHSSPYCSRNHCSFRYVEGIQQCRLSAYSCISCNCKPQPSFCRSSKWSAHSEH